MFVDSFTMSISVYRASLHTVELYYPIFCWIGINDFQFICIHSNTVIKNLKPFFFMIVYCTYSVRIIWHMFCLVLSFLLFYTFFCRNNL